MTVVWFRPGQLGDYEARQLGDGGQGTVYGVPTPPGGLVGDFAYKEYREDVPCDGDALMAMTGFPSLLYTSDRAFLIPRLAWPVGIAYDGPAPTRMPPSANPGTRVVGFLMRRTTWAYELDSTALGKVKQQALEFLLNDDAYLTRIGLSHVDDVVRMELLTDLAHTISRLHRLGVVVGDLSPKNVLFTVVGYPRILLIDCDSMRYRGRTVLAPVDTPDWEVPEADKATPASDAWKFGLIAMRLFSRSQTSTDLGPLFRLSPGLADLAARSQSNEPRRRPAVGEWLPQLRFVLNGWRIPPPPPYPPPPPPPRSWGERARSSWGGRAASTLLALLLLGSAALAAARLLPV
ncbi:hypothetical protein [Streptomyces fulvoviolaceus]|uniref:hypothetical protein n=1 Tax=Streptomyces fulvoviolaceus TaxID=285535 RepID=UPI0021BEDA47|nr:hypothetical protein [Streptomyces fulvoviolaceus]MCT9080109.1 hypothetical protein [Streptomyces fulvoviolaceus]